MNKRMTWKEWCEVNDRSVKAQHLFMFKTWTYQQSHIDKLEAENKALKESISTWISYIRKLLELLGFSGFTEEQVRRKMDEILK